MQHRQAHEILASTLEALITLDAPLRDRLAAAEAHFANLEPDRDFSSRTQLSLYYRIAATLVSGGEDDGDEYSPDAVRESIAALGEVAATEAAMDMLRLYGMTLPASSVRK
jgi:hypothetical protein